MGDEFVRLSAVRAISDNLVLICELRNGGRVGIPHRFIAECSEVRNAGDTGTLVICGELARNLGIGAEVTRSRVPRGD